MIYRVNDDGLYVRALVDVGQQDDPNIPITLVSRGGALRRRLPTDQVSGPNHSNNNNTLSGYSGLQTVAKNKEGFTDRQVEAANQARSGYHMAGAPDIEKFKLAIRGGFFKNCPITEADIKNAEAIYGPSIATRKGKRKRPTPPTVVDDWIEIPQELYAQIDLDLCMDFAFVNNATFLTSIDKQVKFRNAEDVPTRTKSSIYDGIDKVLRVYNHAG